LVGLITIGECGVSAGNVFYSIVSIRHIDSSELYICHVLAMQPVEASCVESIYLQPQQYVHPSVHTHTS